MAHSLTEIEGKYEILEKLQVGGMGAIYKVRHRLLGDVRVVKVLRPQLLDDETFHKRFLREARAATRLIHPNLARLYDFSIDDKGAAYMVMEHIEGWTLDELIVRGELPPLGLALEIARQSLTAIGHLHGHGVIHRDVSPDNLMLARDVDGRPLVKLIDLGLAKSVTGSQEGLTAQGTFVGKFRYAAPEHFQQRADNPVGPRSDLYAFGVVLYELLTGRYPIVGDTAQSLIAGHLYHPPLDFAVTDRGGRVPDDLRTVILGALAKDPGERFAAAEDFAAALEPIARRAEEETAEVERLLALVERPAREVPSRPPSPSTQSRLDHQFGAEPTPDPIDRPAALGAVEAIEAKIAEDDFAAARRWLRSALETAGETPELVELGERIDEMERLGRIRRAEAGLETVERLRAEGRLREALEEALRLRELAPAHKLVRLVVREIEKELEERDAAPTEVLDEAAMLTTTPFRTRYPPRAASGDEAAADEAALAPTELLPTAAKTPEPAEGDEPAARDEPAVGDEPAARDEPAVGDEPAARDVPVVPDARRFDEISLTTIPQTRRAREGPSRRFLVTAVVLFVIFLLLGIALGSLI